MAPSSFAMAALAPASRFPRYCNRSFINRFAPVSLRQPSLPPFSVPQIRRLSERGNGNSQQSASGKEKAQETLFDRLTAPLDQLGATRGVKITVFVALYVFGTMETIFYIKAAIRYFYPPEDNTQSSN